MENRAPEPSHSIEDLWEQADEVPEAMGKEIKTLLLTAEFRSLTYRDDQMPFLRAQELKFPSQVIATLFKLSCSAVWRAIRKREKASDDHQLADVEHLRKPAPNMTVMPSEEQMLLTWIESRQRNGDCPFPREIRDEAEIVLKTRTGEERHFDRHWWRSFKHRQASRIGLVICTAQEPARTAVRSEAVNQYFAALVQVLPSCMTPLQILNLDESGATARPLKGKQKKVVFLTDCPVPLRFRDARDVSDVSVVATISPGLHSLAPLLLMTSEVTFKSRELRRLQDQFLVFRTPKGDMTIEAMHFYVDSVLAAHVQFIRNRFSDQSLKVYLMADNHGTHTNPALLTHFETAGIVPIWLPPHRSHFLQPLGLAVFGSFKRHYANLRRPNVKPQLETKLLRIFHAWHQATYVGCIDTAWRLGAIDVKPRSRGEGIAVVNICKMNQLLLQNCQDAEEWLTIASTEY
jgi:hypothetical protein